MPALTAEQLRRRYDPDTLPAETTEAVTPLEDIIGQKRAVTALRFGLGIQQIGYNVFVAGPPGMGKMTAVQSFLERVARANGAPADWVYVNNFGDAYQPSVYRLPAGMGRQLQQDMKALIDQVRRGLPKAFESDEYSSKHDACLREFNEQRELLISQLSQEATKAGLALEMTPVGVMVIPMLGGRPLNEAEFQALPPAVREDFTHRREAIQEKMKAVMKKVRDQERATQEKLQALDRQVTLYIVSGLMEDLNEKYAQMPEVAGYLVAVQKDILENIGTFKGEQAAKGDGSPMSTPWLEELPFRKYYVNALVDNSKQEGLPVIVESNPTYNNLFGRVEKETQFGALYTDFTMIKPGSLHRANGGYLVVRAEDLLRNLFVWDGLKRALRSRTIEIEEVSERLGYLSTKTLQPQPVPLDVKVVLIGNPMTYQLLYAYDDEFPEIFRVKADFDTRMEASNGNTRDFIAFIATVCSKESLKHLDRTGVARLLEHAARLAEDQTKLSTHFGALADVIREAHYWALQANRPYIGADEIRKALDEKVYRARQAQDHIDEAIARDILLIDVAGATTGQVNGLSVLSLGDYAFGRPSRITASVTPGRDGVLDIEREVELGGPLHSKGVLILNGYLMERYGAATPLSLSARLVFEQSYDGVEGDSASSAELYALLSALAGLPIKQGVAVTGSVNQHGVVQAIGGVNEKIEGFYEVCLAKGLSGEQGVLIPQSNAAHLMLRDDVVEAVRAGRFHIWTVSTIDEGIAHLTGVPAGQPDENGQFPPETVDYRIMQKLIFFGESLKGFPDEDEDEKKDPPATADGTARPDEKKTG
ncbi:MAG: AAA family ATPase [Chloroflexi bacterium]|nr:AAA family ATPase [Chloroflexota bacterium]